MKVKLFNHNDLDAVGCSILGMLAFPDNIDIEYCNYNEVNEKISKFLDNKEYNNYDYIFITDISINEELADRINTIQPEKLKEGFRLGEIVQLFDHHPTAMFLNKYYWAKVQIKDEIEEVSGTSLFYDYLVDNNYIEENNKLDNFVETVKRYDTWLWKNKYNEDTPKKWNDLFYILGKDKFIEHIILIVKYGAQFGLTEFDERLLELEQDKINEYIKDKNKNLFVLDIQNKKSGIVFAESYTSELGHALAKLHPELDFIGIIKMEGFVSYRTDKNDINLGKDIAEIYGGGGHIQAAGSHFNKSLSEEFAKHLFELDLERK